MFFSKKTPAQVSANDALAGRGSELEIDDKHFVSGAPLKGPYPKNAQTIYLGMGCFWGAERLFWQLEGVIVTAVGYQGGFTPNPTYEEVCSGKTGHTEAVMVVFDPTILSLEHVLQTFWEQHDPTQGMAQGNDVGTQYRSAIYTIDDIQAKTVAQSAMGFASALKESNKGEITTEVRAATPFYFAESYHQQYLAKNPAGYCGLAGTGVLCPIPIK